MRFHFIRGNSKSALEETESVLVERKREFSIMGQSLSMFSITKTSPSPSPGTESPAEDRSPAMEFYDYTNDLPDECLALVFQSLGSTDRKRCSLACRRWLRIEGQSRHRLSLNAQSDLSLLIPSLFTRFHSVTKLALKSDRRFPSISDEVLIAISLRCVNLTRLKLRSCRNITDVGIEAFSRNCQSLKKLSCGSCAFGSRAINSVIENFAGLEELSVKRLRGMTAADGLEPIGPDSTLKVVCLKELYNGQCFGPLITGSKSLRTLKLSRCSGNWDQVFQLLAGEKPSVLVEIHLERVQVSDIGLSAISNCPKLEILHLVKTPECTNVGLIAITEKCKLLRKFHLDGWKAGRIGDVGLIAIANNCPNLQELVLVGVNPTMSSLKLLATKCQSLERLALCGSETVGDDELACIAAKCVALKKLCIKSCPVSDNGMEALASGCPNLVKIKVKKCRAVTCEGADWLRASRDSLAVNLDTVEEQQDASASDVAADIGEIHVNEDMVGGSTSWRRIWGSYSFKPQFGNFTGRSFMARTLRRWSSSNSRRN